MSIISKILSRFARPVIIFLVAAAVATASFDLEVLHMNDHHSHIDQETFDLEGAAVPPGLSVATSDIRVKYGGFPRLVSLADNLVSNAATPNVLKLHAGDALTGTSYYSLFKGSADAEMMAKFCFDAFALGNHEFDHGDTSLASFIDDLQSKSTCPDTPVLAANVVPGATSALQGKLLPSTIKTFDNGERVGVVGIDIKSKTEGGSSPSPGTTLTDEATTAQTAIDALLDAGVNKIVLLTHIGRSNDMAWMATLRGVDVIIGGDSHSLMSTPDTADTLGAAADALYPTELTNGDGKKVCVAQAWEYGHGLGQLKVSFDASGDVTSCTGHPMFPFDSSSYEDRTNGKVPLSAADASIVTAWLEAKPAFVATAEDAATKAALDQFKAQVDELKTATIATVPADICYDRFPGQGRSGVCSTAQTQAHGGGACQLVTEGFLHVTPTADIAIQNAGGCRTDIAQGNFTYDSAYALLPFSNTIVTFEMTGAQIRSVLEDALDYGLGGSTGAYPYTAGLKFFVDANATKGNRFTQLMVIEGEGSSGSGSGSGNHWVPIDLSKRYTVAANSYIAGGKSGYTEFTSASVAPTFIDTHTEYAQGFIDFATQMGSLVSPAAEQMSTQRYVDALGHCHSNCPAVTAAPTNEPTVAPTVVGPTAAPTNVPTDANTGDAESTGVKVDSQSSTAKSLRGFKQKEGDDSRACERLVMVLAALAIFFGILTVILSCKLCSQQQQEEQQQQQQSKAAVRTTTASSHSQKSAVAHGQVEGQLNGPGLDTISLDDPLAMV